MDVKEHAKVLADFFTKLYAPNEIVHIYPALSLAKRKEVQNDYRRLKEKVHGRELRYKNPKYDGSSDEPLFLPRQFLKPYRRRAGSTQTKVIEELYDFVDRGYDIYFVVNPLSCPQRCQRTVKEVRHVVLEADEATPEMQETIFKKYQDYFSAIIFTGNKSYHAYARLDPALPNFSYVGWKTARDLNQNGERTTCDLPAYGDAAQFWINEMRGQGLQLDEKVAKDFARVSRVPGFRHSESGNVAVIRFLNDDPLGSQELMQEHHWVPEWVSLQFDEFNPIVGTKAAAGTDVVSDVVSAIASDGVPDIVPVMVMKDVKQVGVYTGGDTAPYGQGKNRGAGHGEHVVPVKRGREERITETNLKPGQRFLDHLQTYDHLKRDGIPSRHLRRSYHVAMFASARVFGWDRQELTDEWRTIVTKHPEHIGLTPEQAVQELMGHLDSSTHSETLTLPNTTFLPDDVAERREHLEAALVALGCPEPRNVANMIIRVLWRSVRELPWQCREGTLGIRTSALCKVCTHGRYLPGLEWMKTRKIVQVTDDSYSEGRKTRRYSVNISLIIYLLGFQSSELDWSEGSQWDALLLAS